MIIQRERKWVAATAGGGGRREISLSCCTHLTPRLFWSPVRRYTNSDLLFLKLPRHLAFLASRMRQTSIQSPVFCSSRGQRNAVDRDEIQGLEREKKKCKCFCGVLSERTQLALEENGGLCSFARHYISTLLFYRNWMHLLLIYNIYLFVHRIEWKILI